MKRIIILFALCLSACAAPSPDLDTEIAELKNDTCWLDPDTQRCVCAGSPVILDLDGDGIRLTAHTGGVRFALRAGRSWLWSWAAPKGDDAWLALPGANGVVDDGSELFGDATLQSLNAQPNGFTALAVYDTVARGGNGDGHISAADAVYPSLRLWRDSSHDGVSQREELVALASVGVLAIATSYSSTSIVDQHGNQFRYAAQVTRASWSTVSATAYDVWLVGAPVVSGSLSPQDTNVDDGTVYFSNCIAQMWSIRLDGTLPPANGPYSICINNQGPPYHSEWGYDRTLIVRNASLIHTGASPSWLPEAARQSAITDGRTPDVSGAPCETYSGGSIQPVTSCSTQTVTEPPPPTGGCTGF